MPQLKVMGERPRPKTAGKSTKSDLIELRVPAIEVRQGPRRVLYSFAVDGKLLPEFSAISRLKRPEGAELCGYQRPEVLSHVAEIRNYLESDAPMVPNAVVIAFDKRVRFEPSAGNEKDGAKYGRTGTLVIPYLPGAPDADKPGWVVDGQQRIAAIREARIDRFPVCAIGFVAASDAEQREQFILVNATKPLPKGLIYELLPSTTAKLPSALQRRRFPAYLSERLNSDDDSPLRGRIRTPTNPATKTEPGRAAVADNSILRMIENSLADGVLYRCRLADARDSEPMLEVLKNFWGAVAEVFPLAWKESPRRSRLTHGAGILSMGFVMDAIADRHRDAKRLDGAVFADDLAPLKPICRWTEGHWDFGPNQLRKWNEIQNTPKDVQLLANYLLTQYKALVWSRPA